MCLNRKVSVCYNKVCYMKVLLLYLIKERSIHSFPLILIKKLLHSTHMLFIFRLLVIFMFLLCSGGGWWYRCWLRGRFPETQTSISRTSAIPTTAHPPQQHRRSALLRTTRSTPATPVPPPTEASVPPGQNQFQVARVSYSTSGDRLILHRLWKGVLLITDFFPPSPIIIIYTPIYFDHVLVIRFLFLFIIFFF